MIGSRDGRIHIALSQDEVVSGLHMQELSRLFPFLDCILTNKSVSPDDHFMMSMFMAEAFP